MSRRAALTQKTSRPPRFSSNVNGASEIRLCITGTAWRPQRWATQASSRRASPTHRQRFQHLSHPFSFIPAVRRMPVRKPQICRLHDLAREVDFFLTTKPIFFYRSHCVK